MMIELLSLVGMPMVLHVRDARRGVIMVHVLILLIKLLQVLQMASKFSLSW